MAEDPFDRLLKESGIQQPPASLSPVERFMQRQAKTAEMQAARFAGQPQPSPPASAPTPWMPVEDPIRAAHTEAVEAAMHSRIVGEIQQIVRGEVTPQIASQGLAEGLQGRIEDPFGVFPKIAPRFEQLAEQRQQLVGSAPEVAEEFREQLSSFWKDIAPHVPLTVAEAEAKIPPYMPPTTAPQFGMGTDPLGQPPPVPPVVPTQVLPQRTPLEPASIPSADPFDRLLKESGLVPMMKAAGVESARVLSEKEWRPTSHQQPGEEETGITDFGRIVIRAAEGPERVRQIAMHEAGHVAEQKFSVLDEMAQEDIARGRVVPIEGMIERAYGKGFTRAEARSEAIAEASMVASGLVPTIEEFQAAGGGSEPPPEMTYFSVSEESETLQFLRGVYEKADPQKRTWMSSSEQSFSEKMPWRPLSPEQKVTAAQRSSARAGEQFAAEQEEFQAGLPPSLPPVLPPSLPTAPSWTEPSEPSDPWTGTATMEERMYGASLKLGYTRPQVQEIQEQQGLTEPREIYAAVHEEYERIYGEVQGPYTPGWWRQMGPGKRALEGEGALRLRPGERKPPSWQTPEGMLSWQGARTFYDPQTLMGAGIYLPGQEPGAIRTTVARGKIAKRAAQYERMDPLTAYGPGGEKLGQEAYYRTGPSSVAKSQKGVALRAAIPFFDVMPSGQALMRAGVISTIGREASRTISIPEGATGMPAVGTRWDLAKDQPVPYEGAQAFSFGPGWEAAELIGAEKIRVKDKAGEWQIKQEMRFEVTAGMAGASAKIKTGGVKSTLPVARPGAFEALVGGREDIDILFAAKDPLAIVWENMQLQSPQMLADLLGVNIEDVQGKTWQELGTAYTEKFRTELLQYKSEEHPQGLIEDIPFTMMAHRAQIEAGYFARGEDPTYWIKTKEAIEGRSDILRVTTKKIPTLIAPMYTVIGRDDPGRRPFLSLRELESLKRAAPEEYKRVMAASEKPRQAYAGLMGAAYATKKGMRMPGAEELTQQTAQELLTTATGRVVAETGIEDVGKISRQQMTAAMQSTVEEKFGAAPLDLPGGQGYLMGAQQLGRFMAGGTQMGEEIGALPGAWAGAIEAVAGGEKEGIAGALRKQEEIAGGGKTARRALGAFLPRQEAYEGTFQASMALAPAEVMVSSERVMRAYGIDPTSDPGRAKRFMAGWESGEIRPGAQITTRPTAGDEPAGQAIRIMSPGEAAEKEVALSEETPLTLSLALTLLHGSDVDSDRALARLKAAGVLTERGGVMRIEGGLPFATDEEVIAGAKLAVQRGAGSLAEEFLSGKSPEEWREALKLENMTELTGEEYRQEFIDRAAMQEKIGPTYATLEAGQLAARRAGDVEATETAETLFGTIHGIRQRPAELPKATEGFMRMIQSAKLFTGGIAGPEGGFAGRRFGTYASRLTIQTLQLTRPGTRGVGQEEALLTPEQAAAALTRQGGTEREEMTGFIKQWQGAMAAGQAGAAGKAGGGIAKIIGGMGEEGFLGTLVGSMAFPRAFARLKREAEGGGEKSAEAQAALERLDPTFRAQLEETTRRQEAYREMQSKQDIGVERKMDALREYSPEMYELLFPGGFQERPAGEAISAEMPVTPEAPIPAAAGAGMPPTGGPPPPIAPPSDIPEGFEPTEAGKARQQEAWNRMQAAKRAAGQAPAAPAPADIPRGKGFKAAVSAIPLGPGETMETAEASYEEAGAGFLPSDAEDVLQAAGVSPDVAEGITQGLGVGTVINITQAPEKAPAYPPISSTDFRNATEGFSELIDDWRTRIKPKVDRGEPLTAGEMAVTRKLETWRKAMWRGTMQAETDPEWATKQSFSIGMARSLIEQQGTEITPAEEVGAASYKMVINEMKAKMGVGPPPTALTPRGLAFLSTAGTERLQGIRGIGPVLGGRIESRAASLRNLANIGGFTSPEQLARLIPGISEEQATGMIPGIETEAAWAGAGGRENIEGLYQALQGAGIGTEAGQRQYGAAMAPQARRFARNIAQLQKEPGMEVPERYQQFVAQMGMAEEAVGKGRAAREAELIPEDVDRSLARFRERLDMSSEGLETLGKRADELAEKQERGIDLSKQEQQEFAQAQRRAKQTLAAIRGLPGEEALAPDVIAARRQAEDIQDAGWRAGFAAEEQAGEPLGLGQQIMGGIGGVAKGLMSGWGMMRMRRYWGMTGGYAMGQIPLAAQEEQAAAQAAMVGVPMGEYQPGGMALGMMTHQAQRQNWQADVGRYAAGAYGWAQRGGLGEGTAAAVGIGGVGVGAGMIGAQLATWGGMGAAAGPIGLAIAGGTALVGASQYTRQQISDPSQMAMAAAGGGSWLDRLQYRFIRGQGQRRRLDRPAEALPDWAREQTDEEMAQRGETIMGGELGDLDLADRQAAIQLAAEQATKQEGPLSWMRTEAVTQLGGQWMRYTPGATNIQDIVKDPRFAQMAARGVGPEQFAQTARQWGMPSTDWQQIQRQQFAVGEPEAMQAEDIAGQYKGFMSFGIEGMDIRERAYGGDLGFLSSQGRLDQRRMLSGSQYWWSQAGRDLGQAQWQTVDPTSGMGIGTNWGGDVLGQRLDQTGEVGERVSLQGGNVTFDIGGGSTVSIGFNQWELQDFQIGQQRGMADWQEGFQRGGLALGASYTTGEGGPFAGRGQWQMQDQMRDVSRGWQMQQFGFQREGMELGDRQFGERWQQQWDRLGTTGQQWLEDASRGWQRQQTQFGWQREDLAFQGQQTSLGFGWQMEDFEEQERFATGRQRQRIRTQRERATIQFGMGMGRLETQGERIDQREEWAEEDFNRAKERHNQGMGWQRESMLLQRRHHNENMDLAERRLDASIGHFKKVNELQDKQTEVAREYWKLQHDRQIESLDKAHDYRKLQEQIQDAQLALGRAQQLQVKQFAAMWESGGLVQKAWDDFFDYLTTKLDSVSQATEGTYVSTSEQWRRSPRGVIGGR